jgi:hypothetical protein
MKIKNSKFKNTGILYELLIRQFTSDIFYGNKSEALNIIRKYFSKSELSKELLLYETLINSVGSDINKANTVLHTIIEERKKLNNSNLNKQKYNLIKEIKDKFNLDSFLKAKISNYKEYAALYNLFELSLAENIIDPQQIVNNKTTLLEFITNKNIDKKEVKNQLIEDFSKYDKDLRLITYKVLLNKFNGKYSSLLNEQKEILREFINNVTTNDNLKEFINNKYLDLKKSLRPLIKRVDDKIIKVKLNEIYILIKEIPKNHNVKDNDVITLMQYYDLINELKKL